MSQPLCYFLIQNDEISGSSSISNDNFGAINNWKKLNGRDSLNVRVLCPILCSGQNSGSMPEFYVLEKIAQVQCLGSIHRLNVQAQYSGSISKLFCAKKIVQAQCSRSMFRLNVPYLSGIL